ncbi:hypothetical protein H2201_000723 [Coniosporium apollinis]|uniref:Uncharacterized protein n=2 Tax=Coniosporium TaxID=2810619 RepID=A0ABQ9P5V5_9PEZI|nr:hypothetical protein H2199_002685 [Cladosporium sp. JES 115]KAJ9669371.1 hypothetical protein H2201_000723 [Coniosporium apollinis]
MATLAEILNTHFAHGYTFNGRGFSTYRARRSVKSVYGFTPDDWEGFLEHTLDHGALERNYEAQAARRRARAEQVRRLEETNRGIALMERYLAVQVRLRKIEEKEAVVTAADAAKAKIILDRSKFLRAAAKRIIRIVDAELLIKDAELLLEGYRALEKAGGKKYKRLIDDHWAEYVQKEEEAKASTQLEVHAETHGSRTSKEDLQLEAQHSAAQHMEGQSEA